MVPLGVFAMVVAIVYLGIRKKERMALLQYNKDASVFSQGKCSNPSLKYGLLLVALGSGMLIADYLSTQGYMDEEAAYFSLLSLSSGIALLVYYFLERGKVRQDNNSAETDL